MNGLSTAISDAGSAIGRYFSLVSFVPSLFLVSFTFTLIKSGALGGSGELDWAMAGDAFTHIGNLALLTLLSIALGVIVHPIQFAIVQFFEGYWGIGRLAQRARVSRISHHYRRFRFLKFDCYLEAIGEIQEADEHKTKEIQEADEQKVELGPKARIKLFSIADESARLLNGYPTRDDDIMPTRLGNVLRRYERLAGSQYGLDAVTAIRHVAFMAPPERIGYLNDQRQQLDLAVRMSATSIAATLIAIGFLWQRGPWLLIALAPYGIAYLSYRGAITAAHEYGAAVSAIMDLDRFALYDYLRMHRPKSTADERRRNAQLMRLLGQGPLGYDPRIVVLPYEYRDASTGTDKDPTGTDKGQAAT